MNEQGKLVKHTEYLLGDIIELRERVKLLEKLLPVVKQSIRAITVTEANDAMGELLKVLREVEPSYFITAKEWLKNPTFDEPPETD